MLEVVDIILLLKQQHQQGKANLSTSSALASATHARVFFVFMICWLLDASIGVVLIITRYCYCCYYYCYFVVVIIIVAAALHLTCLLRRPLHSMRSTFDATLSLSSSSPFPTRCGLSLCGVVSLTFSNVLLYRFLLGVLDLWLLHS